MLAHDNETVRKCCSLCSNKALVGIWVAKDGVQFGHKRHLQAAQQLQNMPAGRAAEDSIFVLQAHDIDIAEIQKVGGSRVGIQVVFSQLESYLRGIAVSCFGIVDWQGQQIDSAIFRTESGAQVGCERSDATLPRKIIPNN